MEGILGASSRDHQPNHCHCTGAASGGGRCIILHPAADDALPHADASYHIPFSIMDNAINTTDTVIIKIGTEVITEDGLPDLKSIQQIANQIVEIKKHFRRVVLVSSGAVAFGRSEYGQTKRDETTEEKQLLASVGQGALIEAYRQCFRDKCLVSQLLVTKEDFDSRRGSRNIRNTIEGALEAEKDTIPIVNENDTVATQELMFTDNDHLSYVLAKQLHAQRLVFASCINGVRRDLHDKNSVIPSFGYGDRSWRKYVPKEAVSTNGKGGMFTKCLASEKLQSKGTTSHIIYGREENGLIRLLIDGEQIGTTFLPK